MLSRLQWVLALLLLAGCPDTSDDFGGDDDTGDSGGDDDASGGDDDDLGDDDSGGGDDDDSGAGDDDDDTTGMDDDDSASGEIDGFVAVHYSEVPGLHGGIAHHLTFTAGFQEVLDPGSPDSGVVFIGATALDTCAVTRYAADDIVPGAPAQVVPLSAGTLTLDGPPGNFEIEPMVHGDAIDYAAEFTPGPELEAETTWSIHATGGTFPPFVGPDALVLSSALHLVSPSSADYFEIDGDLVLEWTGGSLADAVLEIVDDSLEDDDNTYVHCWIANDGHFVVPASVTDQLPPDDVWFQISQPMSAPELLADERAVSVASGVMAVTLGYKI